MSTQKNPATLSSSLVAIKGQATPSSPLPTARVEPSPTPAPAPLEKNLKAMTLKLDRERYMSIKKIGLDEGKSSQQLLSEAVDLLLKTRMAG